MPIDRNVYKRRPDRTTFELQPDGTLHSDSGAIWVRDKSRVDNKSNSTSPRTQQASQEGVNDGIRLKFLINLCLLIYVTWGTDAYSYIDCAIAFGILWLTDFLVLALANFGLSLACSYETKDNDELMEWGFTTMLVLYLAIWVAYICLFGELELSRLRTLGKRCCNIAMNFATLLGIVGVILDSQSQELNPVPGFRFGCDPHWIWAAGMQFETTSRLPFILILYVNTIVWETFHIRLLMHAQWTCEAEKKGQQRNLWGTFFLIDLLQIILEVMIFWEMHDQITLKTLLFGKLVHDICDMFLDEDTWTALGLP